MAVSKHKVYTKTKENSVECEWTISEATLRMKTKKSISTSEFVFPSIPNSTFSIHFYPNGYFSNGYVSVYIRVKTNIVFSTETTLSIKNSDFGYDDVMRFSPTERYEGYKRFMTRGELLNPSSRHLKNGKIVLNCKMKYMLTDSLPVTTICTKPKTVSSLASCLLKPKTGLFDCIIAVGTDEIQAHKLILAVNSPVFAAMFKGHTLEAMTNKIQITDFDFSTVKRAVNFCYTRKLDNFDANVDELLRFSDKYDISELKKILEAHFIQKLTVETVCSLATLADQTNALELKNNCVRFLMDNFNFLQFLADVPENGCDFLLEVLKQFKKKSQSSS
uniref:BTB domain-containing protein n=1 Tax=Panagrolaimus sp. JU765 TaxID=591449 RepID=A0AC34QIA0_9BILA